MPHPRRQDALGQSGQGWELGPPERGGRQGPEPSGHAGRRGKCDSPSKAALGFPLSRAGQQAGVTLEEVTGFSQEGLGPPPLPPL